MEFQELYVRELTRLYKEKLWTALPPLYAAYMTQDIFSNSKAFNDLEELPSSVRSQGFPIAGTGIMAVSPSKMVPWSEAKDFHAVSICSRPSFYTAGDIPTPDKIISTVQSIRIAIDRLYASAAVSLSPKIKSIEPGDGTAFLPQGLIKGFMHVSHVTNDQHASTKDRPPFGLRMLTEHHSEPTEIFEFAVGCEIIMCLRTPKCEFTPSSEL